MDRHLPPHMPSEQRQLHHQHAPSFPPPQPFHMQTGQPPAQIPFSDPFPQNRDPFLPAAAHQRRESLGRGGWIGHGTHNGNGNHHHPSPSQQHQLPRQPPHHPLPNGIGQMPLPFDPSRRRSLGGNASPPQFAAGPIEPPAAPPSFSARNMPPPSPPQMHPHSAASSVLGPAPRGPPTASPFAGIRDLASLSSHHRPNGGMSISSLIGGGGGGGGGDEPRKTAGSPRGSGVFPSPTSNNLMQPPSPGRARATSMREGYGRQSRELSPGRLGAFGEPRSASAALGHERFAPEVRRENMFRSPQLPRESAHSFRSFRAPPEQSQNMNGENAGAPGRPSSQPEISGPGPNRSLDEIMRRDDPTGGRLGVFRAFGDGPHKSRTEAPPRQDAQPFHHQSIPPTSQPTERSVFGSPRSSKEGREQIMPPGRLQPGTFGPPMREEQAGLFRPAFGPPPQSQVVLEQARESIESRSQYDPRRDLQRSSPPLSDQTSFGPQRNGHHERPLTLEEHQRMEAVGRELEQRKGSDGAMPRALMNLSPELSRRGRNSPLPQAVQGAQPRHIGPGGASVKREFGLMFSGLGSGVGSTTPVAGQSANGNTTPSRLSPTAHQDGADAANTIEGEDGKSGSKIARGGKKNGRRLREDTDKPEAEVYDGRMTPSLSQRGSKRSKTAHHHHHHAHHHHHHHPHEPVEPQPSPFNMLRFPSNPLSHSSLITNPSHHHHHHHAHPGHHHHHNNNAIASKTAPAPRKPTITISSKALLDSVAHKPRKHLGSHLYDTTVSDPPTNTLTDHRHPYTSTMRSLPRFTSDRENCTLTVRIPRWHLVRSTAETPGRLEEICKRRQLFGSEIYTDDSDVVAAAVHSGWLAGDFGEYNEDLLAIQSEDEAQSKDQDKDVIDEVPLELSSKPKRPVIPPPNYDAHITILILPPLESYASTNQHHLLSREWKGAQHDGMSYTIHSLSFVSEGPATRSIARGPAARKARIAIEESARLEAARALMMLPSMSGGGASVGVGA